VDEVEHPLREGQPLEQVAAHVPVARRVLPRPRHQVQPHHQRLRVLPADLDPPAPGPGAHVQHPPRRLHRGQEVAAQGLAQGVVLEVQAVGLPRMPGEEVGGALPLRSLGHGQLHLPFPGRRHRPGDRPLLPGRGQQRPQGGQAPPPGGRGQVPAAQVHRIAQQPPSSGPGIEEQLPHRLLERTAGPAGEVLQVGDVGPGGGRGPAGKETRDQLTRSGPLHRRVTEPPGSHRSSIPQRPPRRGTALAPPGRARKVPAGSRSPAARHRDVAHPRRDRGAPPATASPRRRPHGGPAKSARWVALLDRCRRDRPSDARGPLAGYLPADGGRRRPGSRRGSTLATGTVRRTMLPLMSAQFRSGVEARQHPGDRHGAAARDRSDATHRSPEVTAVRPAASTPGPEVGAGPRIAAGCRGDGGHVGPVGRRRPPRVATGTSLHRD